MKHIDVSVYGKQPCRSVCKVYGSFGGVYQMQGYLLPFVCLSLKDRVLIKLQKKTGSFLHFLDLNQFDFQRPFHQRVCIVFLDRMSHFLCYYREKLKRLKLCLCLKYTYETVGDGGGGGGGIAAATAI